MKFLILMAVLACSELETTLPIEKPFDNKFKNCTRHAEFYIIHQANTR